jgi:hypothetical protein
METRADRALRGFKHEYVERRGTEDIKDILISVSAISAQKLIEHHVADNDDITRTVPCIC